VGKLLGEKFHRGVRNIWGKPTREFFMDVEGKILPYWKL
jgi:hypothetical protein